MDAGAAKPSVEGSMDHSSSSSAPPRDAADIMGTEAMGGGGAGARLPPPGDGRPDAGVEGDAAPPLRGGVLPPVRGDLEEDPEEGEKPSARAVVGSPLGLTAEPAFSPP